MTQDELNSIDELVHYFHELGNLKFRKRIGWQDINILGDNCETIAAHSFRTAIIAYYLALLIGKPKNEAREIGFLALLHDLEEVKTGDLTPRQKSYLKPEAEKARKEAIKDEENLKLLEENTEIIKDADKLDMILQAKEYYDLGNRFAYDWIVTGKQSLKLKQSRYLAELIETINSKSWVFRE